MAKSFADKVRERIGIPTYKDKGREKELQNKLIVEKAQKVYKSRHGERMKPSGLKDTIPFTKANRKRKEYNKIKRKKKREVKDMYDWKRY